MRSIDSRFYNRKKWKEVRKAYYESVYGLCERCGSIGEEVHHKVELNPINVNDPKIAFGMDNLELLCVRCHNETKIKRIPLTKKGLAFNEHGDLIKIE